MSEKLSKEAEAVLLQIYRWEQEGKVACLKDGKLYGVPKEVEFDVWFGSIEKEVEEKLKVPK